MKIDRGMVLKSFLDKIREAKRYSMKDVRFSMKELDDLSYVIYGLMSEDISKLLQFLEDNKMNLTKKEEDDIITPSLNGGSF